MKKKILIVLTLCSMVMVSIAYAKYSGEKQTHNSARVVKFGELSVTETGNTSQGKYIIEPGKKTEKVVTIHFGGSETKTSVYVTILAKNWSFDPDAMKYTYDFFHDDNTENDLFFTIEDGWEYAGEETVGTEISQIFKKTLNPNQTLASDIITGIDVGEHIMNSELKSIANQIDITFYAKVKQEN